MSDHQRQGIGRLLFQAIETQALEWKLDGLFVEASITARPFFERMGFRTMEAQEVSCRGQSFVNYKKQKKLL